MHEEKKNFVFRWFNTAFAKVTHTYTGHIGSAVRHAPRWMMVFVLISVLTGFLYTRLPGSFLPEEDQGFALAIVQLPPGASLQRTNAAMADMRNALKHNPAVDGIMQVAGFSFLGSGENVGMAFIRLKPWGERGWSPEQKTEKERHDKLVKEGKAQPIDPHITATEFIQQANGAVQSVRDAQIFVINLPTVQGLGQFGGFDMYLQDRGGAGRDALTEARNTLLGKASQSPLLTGVRPNGLEDAPQLRLDVDRTQAQSMGLQVGDIYNAISLMLAPVYVNDFSYGGRVKRVIMQADCGLSHGPGGAAAHLHAKHAEQQRRHPADDPAVQRGAGEVADVVAVADPLQRLLGGRDRRLAGTGPRLGRGDERDAENRRRRSASRFRLSTGPASRTRKSSPATPRCC